MRPQRHHALPPEVESSLNANSFTLLVVDDLPANRLLLERLLERVGYGTAQAGGGEEALARLDPATGSGGAPPDLAILDVEMPGMNGIELTRRIRAVDPEFPLIVASGNPTDEMREKALAAGADLFLTKPFDFPALLRAVRALLTGSGTKFRRGSARSAKSPARDRAGRSSAPNEMSIGDRDRLPS